MKSLTFKRLSFFKIVLITAFLFLFLLLGGCVYMYTYLSSYFKYNEAMIVWQVICAGLTFIFIKHYDSQILINPREMFNFKRINLKLIFIILSIITLIELIISLLIHKRVSVNENFDFFKSTVIFFFEGLTEELIFRGWTMNAISKTISIKKANIIQSSIILLFLSISFISFNKSSINTITIIITQIIYIIMRGYISGIVFVKTKSIWNTIIIKCFNAVIGEFFSVTIY